MWMRFTHNLLVPVLFSEADTIDGPRGERYGSCKVFGVWWASQYKS